MTNNPTIDGVSRELPERKTDYDVEKHSAYLHGWNACLDATDALNGELE